LEKNLKKLKEVEQVEINVKEGIVLLQVANYQTIDGQIIRKQVVDAGFTPGEIVPVDN
jgi:copper chaperone CopZ